MFVKTFEVRWSEVDPNRHIRHTMYGDYAVHVRISFFSENGFPVEKWQEMGIGPVVIAEQIEYRREVLMGETIKIDFQLAGVTPNRKRFRLRHHVYKEDGSLAAMLTLIIGWINTSTRKLILPDENHPLIQMIRKLPKSDDYTESF